MTAKIKIFFLLNLIIFFSGRVMAQEASEALVTDIKWEEKENLLTYNLSKDARLKIRAGIYSGPVYRTVVNLEGRSAGKHQELWNGKDEEGKIDFLKYGKLHFCVDVPVRPAIDSVLNVKLSEGVDFIKGPITIDVQDELRSLFVKNGAELRVYLDNKLRKIERLNAFPYTFNLKIDDVPEGKHLITINLWQALDFSSVAYKSLEMFIVKEKGQAPIKKGGAGPSKGKFAFCQRDKEGFWQVFTSALEGGNIRQLTSTPVDKRYPAFSSNGKKIAYVNNLGELWIMDNKGSNNRKIPLPINCSEPKFSPDGNKIIFTSLEDVYHGSTKIWEVDLEALELKKLVNRPWLQYNPKYSPDQTQVIFTDGPELFGQDVRKLDLKTGDITQITDNGPYDYDMQATFLNSGQELVYSTNEGGDYEIYKMDKFGRDKINLSRNSQSCDIMPQVLKDDSKIFFLSDRTGKFAIWQMNMDGSEVKQITNMNLDISSFAVYAEG